MHLCSNECSTRCTGLSLTYLEHSSMMCLCVCVGRSGGGAAVAVMVKVMTVHVNVHTSNSEALRHPHIQQEVAPDDQ